MVPAPPRINRLAPGTALLGPYKGSGFVEPPYILRRPDGRMVAVSPLLHELAAALESDDDLGAIAAQLSSTFGRTISVGSIEYLLDNKLRPLGVLDRAGDAPAIATRGSPLLGLNIRARVASPHLVNSVATVLQPLFRASVVGSVLVALVVSDVVALTSGGLMESLDDVVAEPALLLIVVALTIVAGAFHELGHATASRYGGAEPGTIGVGIYLVWPVFYNDMHDSHRLSRAGRLRCDLGGIYFNAVFVVLIFGLYQLTGMTWLLAVVLTQHLVILQQLLPFVRLDGYYVVSDLAGVPDLFERIRPTLAGLVSRREPVGTAAQLRPGARAIVLVWALLTVPLIGAAVILLGAHLPALTVGVGRAMAAQGSALAAAARAGAAPEVVLGGMQLLLAAVPAVGLAWLLARLLAHAGRSRIGRRVGTVVLGFGAPQA